jgi:hypothetical protein
VETNEFLQTRFPNIYAAGDVAGPYQFTHTAAHQAWYAAVNALFDPFKKFKADYAVIPAATFIDPEVARVGLNEQEARAQGIAFETSTYQLDDLDRAIADGEAHGFVKVLTVPGKDRILGVTIVGEHAADLIAEYVLAMKHGIGLNKILGTIHIYPTLAEANKYAAGVWKKAHAPQGCCAGSSGYIRGGGAGVSRPSGPSDDEDRLAAAASVRLAALRPADHDPVARGDGHRGKQEGDVDAGLREQHLLAVRLGVDEGLEQVDR